MRQVLWAAVMAVTGVAWLAWVLTVVFDMAEFLGDDADVLLGTIFLVGILCTLVGIVGLYTQRAVLPRWSVWLLIGGYIGSITFFALSVADVITTGPLWIYLSLLFSLLIGLTWLAMAYALWSGRSAVAQQSPQAS